MSLILVDELVNLAGTDKVTFTEGLKVTAGEALDLDGAKINIDTGVGLDNQLLSSTGSGLKWVTISNTNSTYSFSSLAAAANDVKLKLTGSGDATGQIDEVSFTGSGTVVVTENAGVITITGSDQNTTYDLVASTVTDGAQLTLTGTDSSNDIFSILGGSNITVARSGTDITISSALSGTVGAPATTTDGAVALFDGTDGTLLKNSALVLDGSNNLTGVNDITANSITTAADTASLITFWYDLLSSFPSATTYNGAFAFSDSNNTMYYAAGNSWHQIAQLGDIIPNTNTTYSIALTGTDTGILSLNDSDGIADSVTFLRNIHGGVEIFRDVENLHIDSRLYNISAETGAGSGTTLRLRGTNHDGDGNVTTTVDDDISLVGANGLTVELTDANTITFRQSAGSGSSYTDDDAKDAAAQALLNGTSLGISFSYDSGNKTISAQVGTTPTTYSLDVDAEVGNGNYLITGSDRGNSYSSSADPSITIYEGDTITFNNTVSANHPLYIRVSDGGSSVSSPAASGEGTATTSWTPTTAGVYYYQCGNHAAMLGTLTVLSTGGGGGGGGSSVLYDLYGTNTTSNNVFLNLDPSVGTTDQIEFAGGGDTTVSWDSANKRVTLSSTAPVQSDWDATSGLAQILNKPSIPAAYTLPVATTSTLGGVIPDGTTITLDASGNIAAVPGGYTLPIAAAGTLGGVKIGSGLSIDAGGVVTVAAGGSIGLQARTVVTGTTASLADNATENLNITAQKAYILLYIDSDYDAWVRVYTDDASRTADANRSEGSDPTAGSGVIAETRGQNVIWLSPGVIGYNADTPSASDTMYLAVTNRSGSTNSIQLNLNLIRLEA
jgi:plastocyanin